jgi:ribosomal protein L37AE/L43A
LDWLKPGTKASDYKCPACGFWYQLKSKKSPIGRSIRDGAYAVERGLSQTAATTVGYAKLLIHVGSGVWRCKSAASLFAF